MSCHFHALRSCCDAAVSLSSLSLIFFQFNRFAHPILWGSQIIIESLIYKVATGSICTRKANVNLEKGSIHEALPNVCAWTNGGEPLNRSWLLPAQWSWPHSVRSHKSRFCVLMTCSHSAQTHQLHYSLNSSDGTIKRANETPRRWMWWQWVHFSLLEPNGEEKIASWTCDPQDDPGHFL